MKRALLWCAALAGVALVVSLIFWQRVPDPMPVHWNLRGEPDGWAPRWFGLTIMPGTMLLLPLLMAGLFQLDPRRRNLEKSQEVINITLIGTAVLLLAMHVMMIQAAMTEDQRLSGHTVVALIAVFYIVLGNVMPRVKSNWFVGVRTPWTLSSERVWTKTHRIAGWSMVAGGVIALAATLLPTNAMAVVAFSALILSGLVPVAWSYVLWREEQAAGQDGDGVGRF